MRGKGDRRSGCRCPSMSARRSPPTCAVADRDCDGRAVFMRVGRRIGALTSRRGVGDRVARRAPGPGWPGRRAPASSHRRRPRCCGPGRRWPRSARSCATAAADHRDLRQGRPRRPARACACRGRGGGHERARAEPRPTTWRPPGARVQAGRARAAARRVRRLPRRRRRRRRSPSSARWPGRRLPANGDAELVGAAAVGGARLRPPPARHRPGHRGAAAGCSRPVPVGPSPYLYSDADIAALMAAAPAAALAAAGRHLSRP